MHKRNIALAAAMLLAGTAAMAQSGGVSQKDARPHRPTNTANDRRGEESATHGADKQD